MPEGPKADAPARQGSRGSLDGRILGPFSLRHLPMEYRQMKYYDVHYLDALNGGSGMARVRVEELATWLADRPGTLIRKLTPA